MERRNFLKMFGFGVAAITMPLKMLKGESIRRSIAAGAKIPEDLLKPPPGGYKIELANQHQYEIIRGNSDKLGKCEIAPRYIICRPEDFNKAKELILSTTIYSSHDTHNYIIKDR